jgi:hypothetical protein
VSDVIDLGEERSRADEAELVVETEKSILVARQATERAIQQTLAWMPDEGLAMPRVKLVGELVAALQALEAGRIIIGAELCGETPP